MYIATVSCTSTGKGLYDGYQHLVLSCVCAFLLSKKGYDYGHLVCPHALNCATYDGASLNCCVFPL